MRGRTFMSEVAEMVVHAGETAHECGAAHLERKCCCCGPAPVPPAAPTRRINSARCRVPRGSVAACRSQRPPVAGSPTPSVPIRAIDWVQCARARTAVDLYAAHSTRQDDGAQDQLRPHGRRRCHATSRLRQRQRIFGTQEPIFLAFRPTIARLTTPGSFFLPDPTL